MANSILDVIRTSGKPYYVYILRRPNGKPFYVGKGSGKRILSHKNDSTHGNPYKKAVIKKILSEGKDIKYSIHGFYDTESQALKEEYNLIAKYGRKNNGTGILCNMNDGGEHCIPHLHDLVTKMIMSEKRRSYIKENPDAETARLEKLRLTVNSEEHRKLLSDRQKRIYEENPNIKKKISKARKKWLETDAFKESEKKRIARMRDPDVRENMSAAAKKRMEDPDLREKISRKLKGQRLSEETRKKMSESRKGKPQYWHRGVQLSEEHRLKISVANKGKKRSAETKRKISEAAKIREQRKRLKHVESMTGN